MHHLDRNTRARARGAAAPSGLAALLVAILALAPTDSRAMCPMTEYSGTLRTPIDAPLPPELPLLVVIATDRRGVPAQLVDGALAPIPLRVTRGELTQALVGALVGPGLMAYRAEPPLEAGEYTLLGLREPLAVRVAEATLPALEPPQVRSIEHDERVVEGRDGGRVWTDRIELAAPLPPHAVAFVMEVDGSRAQLDLPLRALTSGASTLELRSGDTGHCGSSRPPSDYRLAGMRARPSLVDQWGRVATASADVAITQRGALARVTSTEPGPRCVASAHPDSHASDGLLAALGALALARRRARCRGRRELPAGRVGFAPRREVSGDREGGSGAGC